MSFVVLRLALASALSVSLLAAVALEPLPGHAARPMEDATLAAEAETGMELVVLEVENCIYCRLFRRDVLPQYQASPRARKVPIRFLDLNDKAADDLELSSPVMVVPTVVLIRDKREISRVPGYVGPENFFHAVNHMIGPADFED